MSRSTVVLLSASLSLLVVASAGARGTKDILPATDVDGTHPTATGRRVAWVVGNQAYLNERPLLNPVHDAQAWAELLEHAGFELVPPCYNCTLKQMKAGLKDFADQVHPGDEAFFFYSGHAGEQNGRNLLFPVDTEIASCADLDERRSSSAALWPFLPYAARP